METKNGLTVTQQKKLLLQKRKPKIKATGLAKWKQRNQLVKKKPGSYNNMYWLLDTSGSMAGDKMWQLIDTVTYLLEKYPNVHCVEFEGSHARRIAEDRIPHLTAGGSTPMLDALQLAWGCNPDAIVLVTDGEPTDAPKGLILEEAQAHSNVPISTIGIGENYDGEFLKALADATGGNSVEVGSDELDQLTAGFEEAIGITDTAGKGAIQL